MIRPVRPADVPAVLGLVRQLAAYEFEPDAVEAGDDDLRRALFAETPSVFAHVAVPDGPGSDDRVVGVAVWYVTFSTWTGRHGVHLVDLVVDAAHRGEGHGEALFGELVGLCRARGYTRLDWEVLDALEHRADRRGPQGFYRRQGGAPRPGWTPWRLDGDALRPAAGGTP